MAERDEQAVAFTMRTPRITDHPWFGIEGHDDDPECSECGYFEGNHAETTA